VAETVRIDYEKLRRKRNELGLKTKDVCKELNLYQPSYCNWESGRSKPIRRNAEKLERYFDCKLIFEPLRINPESLKKLRVEKGTKREDLAGRLGINLSTVYNWEAGRIRPTQKYVDKLIDVFGVGVLCGEEDFIDCKNDNYIDEDISKDIDMLLEEENKRLEYVHKVFAGKV